MSQIYHIVRDNHYDIVHSNMNTLSVFALFPAWLAGAHQRILHNHSTAVRSEGMRSVLKTILRPLAPLFANRYAACSKLAGDWMYGKKKMASGKVTVINNAIDLDEYAFSPELRQKYRQELNIPEDAFVIGHVGRFMFQKNHEFLLDVFAGLCKQQDDICLLLIGDGPLRPAMATKVKDLGLQDSVKFLGLRSDVQNLYNAMDLFVLPSRYEGLPVVSVEAQANGLPILVSTSVTEEAKLTDILEYEPLDAGIPGWVDVILRHYAQKEQKRADTAAMMRAAGFDIVQEAAKLEQYYLDAVRIGGGQPSHENTVTVCGILYDELPAYRLEACA